METHSTLHDKIGKAHIRIVVYVLMLMMLQVKTKSMYYGQIHEIPKPDFDGFKIPLFPCNWVDEIKGAGKDKYGFISVDLNRQRYKLNPFMLANHVTLVFYVPQTSNNIRWLYLKNDESSESGMPSMSLMRFLLSPPR
jgi:hypothetical protein